MASRACSILDNTGFFIESYRGDWFEGAKEERFALEMNNEEAKLVFLLRYYLLAEQARATQSQLKFDRIPLTLLVPPTS